MQLFAYIVQQDKMPRPQAMRYYTAIGVPGRETSLFLGGNPVSEAGGPSLWLPTSGAEPSLACREEIMHVQATPTIFPNRIRCSDGIRPKLMSCAAGQSL